MKARVDLRGDEQPAASRRERFATCGPALHLAGAALGYVEYSERKVGPNYHIILEYNQYSVPKQWIGHDVVLKSARR